MDRRKREGRGRIGEEEGIGEEEAGREEKKKEENSGKREDLVDIPDSVFVVIAMFEAAKGY